MLQAATRNVSTMEVSQVLSSLPGVEEANVYGVQVRILRDDGISNLVKVAGVGMCMNICIYLHIHIKNH